MITNLEEFYKKIQNPILDEGNMTAVEAVTLLADSYLIDRNYVDKQGNPSIDAVSYTHLITFIKNWILNFFIKLF